MTLFNGKDAAASVKERRAASKAPAATDEPKSPNAFQLMAADNKMLRDENDRLATKLRTLAGRLDGLDSRFTKQEAWNVEAQQRVSKLETATAGGSQRMCPGCNELRNDGPEMFPGYFERAAADAGSEFHEWRQLCAVCRDGKQAPEHG